MAKKVLDKKSGKEREGTKNLLLKTKKKNLKLKDRKEAKGVEGTLLKLKRKKLKLKEEPSQLSFTNPNVGASTEVGSSLSIVEDVENPLLKLRRRKLKLKKESVIPNVEGASPEVDILKVAQASGNDSPEFEGGNRAVRSAGDEEVYFVKRVKTKKVKKSKRSKKDVDFLVSKNNSKLEAEKVHQRSLVDEDCSSGMKKKVKKDEKRKKENALHVSKNNSKLGILSTVDAEKVDERSMVDEDCSSGIKEKVKKNEKSKKEIDLHISKNNSELGILNTVDAIKVDEISLVDEDSSCGMRKWINDYKQNRPGLKILQERIDEFIIAHEAQLEKEKKEREAQAAEGGWTVVVHHKGRKKTTDPESGIAVGSVAQAAVLDNMAKKKTKVAEDFYRFQKREARRSEIMMLQSKFEQDKKRIKQLRDARKFKPY
ncbi:ribosomal RNA-processing protein 7 homolog [Zingiber officinale]|uniref:ribosomal RNA-processing protein 7 homolog n=1 Tax=Zingiber officinale TaxID=94328 RepID=UPI001C4DC8F4|nr:ribosomal RNA-processing protein 7 homolog [Zingiber officinale]XP_042408913.1 ribosomal RNA-processing protein 7 homolog [Zingiber officinale]